MTDTQEVLHSLTTILSSHVKVSGGRKTTGECAACDDAYDTAQAVLDALPALGYVHVPPGATVMVPIVTPPGHCEACGCKFRDDGECPWCTPCICGGGADAGGHVLGCEATP